MGRGHPSQPTMGAGQWSNYIIIYEGDVKYVFFFIYCFSGQTSYPVISGSTGPIFTKFSLYGRYLVVDYDLTFFPIAQGGCHGNQF